MFKRIYSKIGIKLLAVFASVLIVSMVSLIYIATHLVDEFGEFSASRNEANIKVNTYAFLARITHEQAMRYGSIFQKIAASSSLIAKQASHVHAHRDLCGEKSLTPNEKLVASPKNGIFSNSPSEKTMVLYSGSSAISPEIKRQITTLSKLDSLLESSKEGNPESTACYVVSESAISRYYPNIHGVDDIPTGFDIREAHWYVKARPENNPERKTVWSNVYMDIVGQGLMTTASSPVYSKAGRYLGAVGIDVTLKSIVNDILGNIKLCHKIENMFSFLVDSTGKIIAFPPEYLTMFDLTIDTDKLVDSSVILEKSLLESSNPEVRKIGKAMIEKPYQISEFSLNGCPYIFSSHFMPSTGWRLGIVVPESVLFASVQETRTALDSTVTAMTTRFTIVALSFLLGTIIIVIVFSHKTIITPLNILSKAALRVREGDLTTQVDVHREDEIGTLAHSFNDMVVTLKKGKELEKEYTLKLEQEVDERTVDLRDDNEELKDTIQMLKQEIVERKAVEEALQESKNRMKAILRASPIGIGLVINRQLEWANETMYRMVRYEQDSLLGKSARVLYSDDEEYKRVGRELYATMSGSETGQVETRWVRKDGTTFDCVLKASRLEPTDYSRGQIVTVVDITDAKKKEQQIKSSLQEKELLLREIHHRVKNNMQVISSLLKLQSANIKDEALKSHFHDAEHRIRAMAMVHGKLYQSKDFTTVPFKDYLTSLIRYLTQFYLPQAGHIKLATRIEELSFPITAAIPCGLIVNELITNALKYAFPDNRPGTITVSLTSPEETTYELSVKDDGIGMPEAIDIHTTQSLGLHLVSILAEDQLKGEITVERTKGTAFHIVFGIGV